MAGTVSQWIGVPIGMASLTRYYQGPPRVWPTQLSSLIRLLQLHISGHWSSKESGDQIFYPVS